MEMWTSIYKLLIAVSMIRSRRLNTRIEEWWMVEASLCCVRASEAWVGAYVLLGASEHEQAGVEKVFNNRSGVG
jgi:hypothetical protein